MRYELEVRTDASRVVAAGTFDAMHAVRRLYGGKDAYDTRNDDSGSVEGYWTVEEQRGWITFDRLTPLAPKPRMVTTAWITLRRVPDLRRPVERKALPLHELTGRCDVCDSRRHSGADCPNSPYERNYRSPWRDR